MAKQVDQIKKMGYRVKFWMSSVFSHLENEEIYQKILNVGGDTVITDHIELVSQFNAKLSKSRHYDQADTNLDKKMNIK